MTAEEPAGEETRISRTGDGVREEYVPDDLTEYIMDTVGRKELDGIPRYGTRSPPRMWFDNDLNSMVYIDFYHGDAGDPLEVTVDRGFVKYSLGNLEGADIGDSRISLPKTFSLADAGMDHLGPYTVRVDGHEVLVRPGREVVLVSEIGEVSDDCSSCSVVFSSGLTPMKGDRPQHFTSRARFRTMDWVSTQGLYFVDSDGRTLDIEAATGDPEETAEETPAPKEVPATMSFSDGRLTLGIPSVPMPAGTSTRMQVATETSSVDCGCLKSFSRMDCSKPTSLDLTSLGISPADTVALLMDGDEVFRSEGGARMFAQDGKATAEASEACVLVLPKGDWVDFGKSPGVVAEKHPDHMVFRFPRGTGFRVTCNSSDTGEPVFGKSKPSVRYEDGTLVLRVTGYRTTRDTSRYRLVQDGVAKAEGSLKPEGHGRNRPVRGFAVDLIGTGTDVLGGFFLEIDGFRVYENRPHPVVFFDNTGHRCSRPHGEILAVFRTDHFLQSAGSTIVDSTVIGGNVYMALDIPFRENIWIGPGSCCSCPERFVPEPEPSPEEPPAEAAPEAAESGDDDPETDFLDPAQWSEEMPSRPVAGLSFDEFFGEECENELWDETHQVYFCHGFLRSKPYIAFMQDHPVLSIGDYIGYPKDDFECWAEQGGRRTEPVMLESDPFVRGRICRRTLIDLSGMDILEPIDVYIDGRHVHRTLHRDFIFFNSMGNPVRKPHGETLVVTREDTQVSSCRAKILDRKTEGGFRYCLMFVSIMGWVWCAPEEDVRQEGPVRERELGRCLSPVFSEYVFEPRFMGLGPRMAMTSEGMRLEVPRYLGQEGSYECTLSQGEKEAGPFDLGFLDDRGTPGSRTCLLPLMESGIDPLEPYSLSINGRECHRHRRTDVILFDEIGRESSRPVHRRFVLTHSGTDVCHGGRQVAGELSAGPYKVVVYSESDASCFAYMPDRFGDVGSDGLPV